MILSLELPVNINVLSESFGPKITAYIIQVAQINKRLHLWAKGGHKDRPQEGIMNVKTKKINS